MANAYKYRPQYTQNQIGPDPSGPGQQAMAEKAAQLVAKWREEAKEQHTTSDGWSAHADALEECADELEEAIRSLAGAEPDSVLNKENE